MQGDVDQVHPRGKPGTIRRALLGPQQLGVGHQREPGKRMPMRRDMICVKAQAIPSPVRPS